MPTYDLTTGGSGVALAAHFPKKTAVMEATLDFSKQGYSIADVLELFKIPGGTFVHHIYVDVQEAVGAAATAQIGDGTDTDAFFPGATVDLNTVAKNCSSLSETTSAYDVASNGKFYASDDTVDLIIGGAAVSAGKVVVKAMITNFN